MIDCTHTWQCGVVVSRRASTLHHPIHAVHLSVSRPFNPVKSIMTESQKVTDGMSMPLDLVIDDDVDCQIEIDMLQWMNCQHCDSGRLSSVMTYVPLSVQDTN